MIYPLASADYVSNNWDHSSILGAKMVPGAVDDGFLRADGFLQVKPHRRTNSSIISKEDPNLRRTHRERH